MNAFRNTSRGVGRVRAIGFAALFGLTSVHAVGAQEPEMARVSEDRARIGVLLTEVCESPRVAEASCERSPLVSSVVVDGPADRAGVQAGDTLLTVNGLDVRRLEGRQLLLNLEAGVPVQLRLGRTSGPLTLQVTPEIRPAEPYVEVRTFFGPPTELGEPSGERLEVIRIPAVRRSLEDVRVRLDSLQSDGNDFVFFHEDTDGTFRVEFGDSARAHVILEHIRGDGSAGDRRGLSVWENEALARRLALVRDSSFRSARVHLDSLVRLRGQVGSLHADSLVLSVFFDSAGGTRSGWTYAVEPRAASGQLRTLLLSDMRVGGAEFRPLSADMAEYFEGVDEGLLVLRVIRDTPADRMGLRDGDVVVEVDGAKCSDVSVLRQAIATAAGQRPVQVKWMRKGTPHVGALAPR